MAKKTISEIREEPGKSNAGKYTKVKSDDFAGPNGTYPINTLKRAKSAIKLAHFASNPGNIVKNVLKKYPELKKDERSPITYGSNPIKFNGGTEKDRVKGKKYNKGDYIDETDHENQKYTTTNKDIKGSDYNVQNISKIQEDDKGQYMVSLDDSSEDRSKKTVSNYNQGRNATRDTLRPKKGKYFKQGWGEDDRNPTGKNWIKKNKKYMKS